MTRALILPPGFARRQRGFIVNPYAYSTGAPDPTTALLHFNGTNGATSTTDEYLNVWTMGGGTTQLDTSTVKFGSASLENDYGVKCATLNAFGSNDFTIDFWSYRSSYYGGDGSSNAWVMWANTMAASGNYYPAVGIATNNFSELLVYASSTGNSWIGGGPVISTGTVVTVLNGWEHYEITRSGSDLRLFVNGTQKGSTYNIGATALTSYQQGLTLGNVGDSSTNQYAQRGFFDELRILNGSAAHTSNFTVPSSAYSPP